MGQDKIGEFVFSKIRKSEFCTKSMKFEILKEARNLKFMSKYTEVDKNSAYNG